VRGRHDDVDAEIGALLAQFQALLKRRRGVEAPMGTLECEEVAVKEGPGEALTATGDHHTKFASTVKSLGTYRKYATPASRLEHRKLL
jgi:hypothetical protein